MARNTSSRMGYERPTRVHWQVFGIGCTVSWMLYLHRYVFALIKPTLQTEFDLNNSELGQLDFAFGLCYSVFQIPAGLLVDLLGAHVYLGAAIVIWSLALGAHAWSDRLSELTAARYVMGFGQAGVFAAISRVTRTWFPPSVRTSVQGWMGVFCARSGGVCSNLLFATVLIGYYHLDWRFAIEIFAVCGVVLGLVFLLVYRNDPAAHPWTNAAEVAWIAGGAEPATVHTADADPQRPVDTVRRKPLRAVLRQMSPRSLINLAMVNAASAFSTFADNVYSGWIPLFLAQVHKLEFKEMGIYSALPLLGGACGGAFGGWLNDRSIAWSGSRRWSRSLVGCFGKGMAAILITLSLLCYQQPRVFCGLLFFVKFFADISLATRWGTMTDIGGKATATVFAFNNSVASVLGLAAPLMYGWISGTYGWKPVFVIAGVMYALCAACWLLVNCTIPVLSPDHASDDIAADPGDS